MEYWTKKKKWVTNGTTMAHVFCRLNLFSLMIRIRILFPFRWRLKKNSMTRTFTCGVNKLNYTSTRMIFVSFSFLRWFLPGTLNPAYTSWSCDQMLLSLVASIDALLWNSITCSRLCSCVGTLGIVHEYMLRIRLLVDNLSSIGDSIPPNQHMDVIMEGLP